MGAGAVLVAPRRSLVAVAHGLDRPVGVWSVTTDPRTGALVALLDAGHGPEVRHLDVDEDGTVRTGSRLLGPLEVEPIGVGADGERPVVLASRAVPPGPAPAADGAGSAVRALLATEPFGPFGLAETAAVERRAATVIDLAGSAPLPAPAHGLVSAMSGPWAVHQHGPDDEADHLPVLSVAAGGATRVLFGDLGLAGVAQLSGPATAPVLSVSDGTGAVRVRRLTGGPTIGVADDGVVAVTATEHDLFATRRGPDGHLAIDRLDGLRWRFHRPIPDTEAATSVVPVGGSSAFVVTGPTLARLVRPGAGR